MASERRQTTLSKYARIQKLQRSGITNARLWDVIRAVKEDPEIVEEVNSKSTLHRSLVAVADRLLGRTQSTTELGEAVQGENCVSMANLFNT